MEVNVKKWASPLFFTFEKQYTRETIAFCNSYFLGILLYIINVVVNFYRMTDFDMLVSIMSNFIRVENNYDIAIDLL